MEGDSDGDGGGDEGTGRPEQDGLESEVLRGKNMDVASMDALKKRIEVRILPKFPDLTSQERSQLPDLTKISLRNVLKTFRHFSDFLAERSQKD